MNTNQNPILAALETLHAKYPTEKVDIWVRQTGEHITYTATVDGPYGECRFGEWLSSPEEAAESLMERAGDRSPHKMLGEKIARLRAELLQAEEQHRAV